jgi:hypothetical protein
MADKGDNVTLWIGGTSSLARTFFVNYKDVVTIALQKRHTCHPLPCRKWIFTGLERTPPRWITSLSNDISIQYLSLDLTTLASGDESLVKIIPSISSMIVAIRPLLFDMYIYTDKVDRMIHGLKILIDNIVPQMRQLKFILNISSVAAADHLRTQSYATETDSIPPLATCSAPYDRFKRRSEDIITQFCQDNKKNSNQNVLTCIHLRIGAIFSDDRQCI